MSAITEIVARHRGEEQRNRLHWAIDKLIEAKEFAYEAEDLPVPAEGTVPVQVAKDLRGIIVDLGRIVRNALRELQSLETGGAL